MKTERSKLQQQSAGHEQIGIEQSAQRQAQEFATVEDLLRHDSAQNPVPGDVALRLNAAIAGEPKPRKPWYRNLFS